MVRPIVRWSLLCAAILIMACTSFLSAPSPVTTDGLLPPDQPVFQVDYPVRLGPIFYPCREAPIVTLWASGRVIFYCPPVRESVLTQKQVKAILDKAQVLYELSDDYSAQEAGTEVRFSIETQRGRKVVLVRDFDVFGNAPIPKDEPEPARRLHDLWSTLQAALPPEAPVMESDEVIVTMVPFSSPTSANSATKSWPKDLDGYLTGDQARAAAHMLDMGTIATFLVDGTPHEVAVMPVLPLLYEPTPNWPRSGIPRHPALTAYNAPGLPYRFARGVTQQEVEAWYKDQMPAGGWRLGGEVAGSQQVWAWEQDDPSPLLVVLRFLPQEMTLQRVEVLNGIPIKSRSRLDVCGETACLKMGSAPLAEVGAWFSEYMMYAGWQAGSESVYSKGNWQVRLEIGKTPEQGVPPIQVLLHRSWIPGPNEPSALSRDQAIEAAQRAVGEVVSHATHTSARLVPGSEVSVRAGVWRQVSEADRNHPVWIVTFEGLPTDSFPPPPRDRVQPKPGPEVVVDALTGASEVLFY